jgi:phosphomannomutase
VKKHRADLGMACDPDADRLVLVDDKGRANNEELTLAIAVRQVLKKTRGTTVINLSTSSATATIAEAMGSRVFYSKVGEANVVQMMREKRAVIGGEGNGGVIYPAFHAGRDSLIGAALTLSCLAEEKLSLSELVGTFPRYYIIKSKAPLPDDFTRRLDRFAREANRMFGVTSVDRRDGIRFDFADGWVQIRSSNTEPIYRLIVETSDQRKTASVHRQITSFFK